MGNLFRKRYEPLFTNGSGVMTLNRMSVDNVSVWHASLEISKYFCPLDHGGDQAAWLHCDLYIVLIIDNIQSWSEPASIPRRTKPRSQTTFYHGYKTLISLLLVGSLFSSHIFCHEEICRANCIKVNHRNFFLDNMTLVKLTNGSRKFRLCDYDGIIFRLCDILYRIYIINISLKRRTLPF